LGKIERGYSKTTRHLIQVGVGLGTLYWVTAALLHALVFQEGTLAGQLFAPSPNDLWMRLLGVGVLVAFGSYSRTLLAERDDASDARRLQTAALEAAANAVVITDREARIVWVNPAFTRLTGYTRDEVIGQTPRLLRSGRQDPSFYKALWDTVLAGRVWHGQLINRRKDGSLYAEEQTVTPVFDRTQTVTHFVAIKQDVTDRQRAEAMLRESEERLRDLVENANDIIYTHDLAGNVTALNRAAEAVSGYTRDEALTMNIDDVVAPEHIDIVHREIERAVAERTPRILELDLITKDGRHVPLEVSARVVCENAVPTGIQGIARDISERKRVEATRQALSRASLQIQEPLALDERLDRLLQAATEVLGLHRLTIFLADPTGERLRPVATTRGENGTDQMAIPIGPEGGSLARAFLTRHMIACDSSMPVPRELRLQPPYDQIETLRTRALVIAPLVVRGRAIGVLGADLRNVPQPPGAVTLDLLQTFAAQAALAIEQARLYEEQRLAAARLEATVEERTRELREANTRLEAASRHKSAFLANMSHELRTPLNNILGFAELLANNAHGALTDQQARYLNYVLSSGRHLLSLINDLLDLSKVEAGRIALRRQVLRLCDALTAGLTEMHVQARAKALQLHLRLDDAPATITADPVRFKQILLNLLSNAVKFTPEGGTITVAARTVPGTQFNTGAAAATDPVAEFVEIAVRDTGIGIKDEDLPRLFQPFTQLESSYVKRYQGTGLGLALTRQLVELHRGQIWAESDGEGRGSTFVVRFPIEATSG
jgi:two-component system sensor histidine kinase/response regulator